MKQKFLPYLYAAYGMNTSVEQMATRCPNAEAVGKAKLAGYKLAFRGVADVIPEKGRTMHVALWRVTKDCIAALDRLEGFREGGGGLYDKVYVEHPKHGRIMFYKMTRRLLAPPSEFYESMLREGYEDFDMPASQIDIAKRTATRVYSERGERVARKDAEASIRAGGWEFF